MTEQHTGCGKQKSSLPIVLQNASRKLYTQPYFSEKYGWVLQKRPTLFLLTEATMNPPSNQNHP